ncbi:MAG: hypothetical protein F7C32_03455 [Desulfurococcales archaeon]|nr:hypothetical protein [Desulfurococcales archaeon]
METGKITRTVILLTTLVTILGASTIASASQMGLVTLSQIPASSTIDVAFMGDVVYVLGSDLHVYQVLPNGTVQSLSILGGNVTALQSVPHNTWPAIIFYRGQYEVGLLRGDPLNPSIWSAATYTPVKNAAYDPVYNILVAVDEEGNLYRASPGNELIPVIGPRGVANNIVNSILAFLNSTAKDVFYDMNLTGNLRYLNISSYTFRIDDVYPLTLYAPNSRSLQFVPGFINVLFNVTATILNETSNETLTVELPQFNLYLAFTPIDPPSLTPIQGYNLSLIGFYEVNDTIFTINQVRMGNETKVSLYKLNETGAYYRLEELSSPIQIPNPDAEAFLAYRSSENQPLLIIKSRSTLYAYEPTLYNATLVWSSQPLLGADITGYAVSRDSIIVYNETMIQALSITGGTPLWNMYNGIRLAHPAFITETQWNGYTSIGTSDGYTYLVNAPTGIHLAKLTIHTCVNNTCIGGINISATNGIAQYNATTSPNGSATLYLTSGTWLISSNAQYLGNITVNASIGSAGQTIYLNYTLYSVSLTLNYQLDPLQLLSTLTPQGTLSVMVNGYNLTAQITGEQLTIENPPPILSEIWDNPGIILLPPGIWDATINIEYYEPAMIELTPSLNQTVSLNPILYNLTITMEDPLGSNPPLNLTITNEELGSQATITIANETQVQLPIGTYILTLHHPSYTTQTKEIEIPTTSSVLFLLERKNFTLTISLRDPDLDTPLGDIHVSLQGPVSQNTSISGTAKAQFTVPCGRYNLTIWGTYYNRTTLQIQVQSNTSLNITLQPITTDLVIVVYDKLTLLPITATVDLEYQMPAKGAVFYEFNVTGSALVKVRPLNYTITATSPHYMARTVELEMGQTTVSIGLERVNYNLTITFTDDLSGVPAWTSLSIDALQVDTGSTLIFQTSNGTLHLTLPWGTYNFTVNSPLYEQRAFTVNLVGNKQLEVTMVRRHFNLTLNVYDADTHKPISFNAYLSLREESLSWNLTGNGTVSITLPWGDYVITVESPSYVSSTLNLTLYNNTSIDVPLTLLRLPLTITILDKDTGDYLTGQVTIQGPENAGLYVQGRTTLYLRPGTYNVTAQAEGYLSQSTIVSLVEGGNEVSFELERIKYNLTVSVTDEEGNPIPNANITITGPVSINNIPPGTFRLPPGHYTITAYAPGYLNKTLEIDLTTSGNYTLALEKHREGGGFKAIFIIGILLFIIIIAGAIYIVISTLKKTSTGEEIIPGLLEE